MTVAQRQLERWMSIEETAEALNVSRRWLEYRVSEGMPSAKLGGKRQFKLARAEDWLQKEGYIDSGAA